jgi:hypothetical protein
MNDNKLTIFFYLRFLQKKRLIILNNNSLNIFKYLNIYIYNLQIIIIIKIFIKIKTYIIMLQGSINNIQSNKILFKMISI